MEEMQFDSGLRTYRVNGKGTLTFNPADPNLYARFQALGESLPEIAEMLELQETEDILSLMATADGELKKRLNEVFPGNDFEALLSGVNLLAVTQSGKTVLENFLDALAPILCQGAEMCAESYAQEAVKKAGARRGSQC